MAKKRKKGEGTLRHRKDGRWEGRVVIGYDWEGNPKTKSVLAKTKAECVKKLEKLKATDDTKRPVKVTADMAFGDWLDSGIRTTPSPASAPPLAKAMKTGSTTI